MLNQQRLSKEVIQILFLECQKRDFIVFEILLSIFHCAINNPWIPFYVLNVFSLWFLRTTFGVKFGTTDARVACSFVLAQPFFM